MLPLFKTPRQKCGNVRKSASARSSALGISSGSERPGDCARTDSETGGPCRFPLSRLRAQAWKPPLIGAATGKKWMRPLTFAWGAQVS